MQCERQTQTFCQAQPKLISWSLSSLLAIIYPFFHFYPFVHFQKATINIFICHIYVNIDKGMYMFKDTSTITYKHLFTNLTPYSYHPVKFTPGLWTHNSYSITFTQAADNFGINTVRWNILNTFLLRYMNTILYQWTQQRDIIMSWLYIGTKIRFMSTLQF